MDHSGWLSRSRRTTAILPTDIVVFIVGPTGSGKSWFMSTLLQHANVHVRVNKAQRPGTTEVHAERCIFDGTQSDIVIVDTPSFCTYTDPDGEEVMREWMDSNYTGRCKAVMMVYMHNLAFNPEDANMRLSNHLGVFRRACRQNLFPSVIHVVPTLSYWARLSDTRVKILTAQLQRQANAEGARLASGGRLFDGEPETAWDVVQGFLNETTPCCNAESSVTMRRMGSFDLFHGSEEAVSISSRRQENDESAQPKKPEVARREPEVAPFMPNPSLPFPPNFAAHEESPVVVHSMDLFDWFRGSERTTAILPTDIAVL
ncbi:hypothetical protein PISMIDRAFT_197921 [Pisolithus microcarpus 441]|uniref:G domain-containing protein n=1 Tax=Pisolithus microcarpus 441 TaxID=765257 RepID=A0A0C9YN01_9AGAM|nr:hypothetical protein BKA83DRAFT_197921 [Pisolithus microcarpus]KIK18081.1 hypothetical protein PISMIDRAFT_197921 [Pisolithus microcarpus 441]